MKNLIWGSLLVVSMNLWAQGDYISKVIADKDGKIIYEVNADTIHPLASVTKLMSAVVVAEEVEAGNITLEDMVPISKDAARRGGSRIELYWGSKVQLRDLLYASLIHSANNATYALAEYVGGDIYTFVDMMNNKAGQLGMTNTDYYTPAGLPTDMTGEGMDISTTEDTAKLSSYALDNELIMEIVGMYEADINNSKDDLHIYNRNKLLNRVEGVTGLKTGHHNKAGYNVTVSFEDEGEEYIAVIMGASSEKSRDSQMTQLIEDFDIDNYKKEELLIAQLDENQIDEDNIVEKNITISKSDGNLVLNTETLVTDASNIKEGVVEFELTAEEAQKLLGGETGSLVVDSSIENNLTSEAANTLEEAAQTEKLAEELEEQFLEEHLVENIQELQDNEDAHIEVIVEDADEVLIGSSNALEELDESNLEATNIKENNEVVAGETLINSNEEKVEEIVLEDLTTNTDVEPVIDMQKSDTQLDKEKNLIDDKATPEENASVNLESKDEILVPKESKIKNIDIENDEVVGDDVEEEKVIVQEDEVVKVEAKELEQAIPLSPTPAGIEQNESELNQISHRDEVAKEEEQGNQTLIIINEDISSMKVEDEVEEEIEVTYIDTNIDMGSSRDYDTYEEEISIIYITD